MWSVYLKPAEDLVAGPDHAYQVECYEEHADDRENGGPGVLDQGDEDENGCQRDEHIVQGHGSVEVFFYVRLPNVRVLVIEHIEERVRVDLLARRQLAGD